MVENKKKNPETEMTEKKPRLPRFAWIFYGIAVLSAVVFVVCLCSAKFSDSFQRYCGSLLRGLLAHLTSWIPFSLAEYLLLLLPVIVVALAWFGIRRYADSWRSVGIYCASLLSVIALVFSMFSLGFAPGYRGTRLDEKLGIERRDVSAEELYATAMILSAELNSIADEIVYLEETEFSVMPYGYSEMSDRLNDAFALACDEYSFLPRLRSRIKPVMLSRAMSYTHITGVYTFFTGEANLNVDFPDYTLPYTAAHELSHQRGIAREDEANFMAFLVCLKSEDSYLRYSAYLNLYEYVAAALYSASPELYWQAYGSLPMRIRGELMAYSRFFEQYRDSVASEVTDSVNNTFLTIQGTEGTKSYGMVVDLAVAYYREG